MIAKHLLILLLIGVMVASNSFVGSRSAKSIGLPHGESDTMSFAHKNAVSLVDTEKRDQIICCLLQSPTFCAKHLGESVGLITYGALIISSLHESGGTNNCDFESIHFPPCDGIVKKSGPFSIRLGRESRQSFELYAVVCRLGFGDSARKRTSTRTLEMS